jgi:hypothetical protein
MACWPCPVTLPARMARLLPDRPTRATAAVLCRHAQSAQPSSASWPCCCG